MMTSIPDASVFVWRVRRSSASRSIPGFRTGAASRAASGTGPAPTIAASAKYPKALRWFARSAGSAGISDRARFTSPSRMASIVAMWSSIARTSRGASAPRKSSGAKPGAAARSGIGPRRSRSSG